MHEIIERGLEVGGILLRAREPCEVMHWTFHVLATKLTEANKQSPIVQSWGILSNATNGEVLVNNGRCVLL